MEGISPTPTAIPDFDSPHVSPTLAPTASPSPTPRPTTPPPTHTPTYPPSPTPTPACDFDGDLFCPPEDCDDTSVAINPASEEICDGIDNNCDLRVDEDAVDAPTWYIDADLDGYGDPDTGVESCVAPDVAMVENGEDCNDADSNLSPETIWYIDSDNDAYGTDAQILAQCEQPFGYVSAMGDCLDSNASAHPNAPELCDSVDNDCNSFLDEICWDAAILDEGMWGE